MADLGINNLFGGLSLDSIRGGIYDYAIYLIWGFVALFVGGFLYFKYKDKKVYIYPVRIYRQRNNGQVKEFNTFGGYIKKGKITQFIIKMSRFKKKPADKLPLSQYMDEDNRVYYWQLNPDSPLIQVKRDFVINKILIPNDKFVEPSDEEIKKVTLEVLEKVKINKEYKHLSEEEQLNLAKEIVAQEIDERRTTLVDVTAPTYSPVPTDLKQQALLEIAEYKNTLGVDVNKQFAYFIIGVIALVILGVIIFYIAVNKGDVPILTK